MRYLFISDFYPEYDRNSADFRLSQFMAAVQEHAEVHFWAIGEERQQEKIGEKDTQFYRSALAQNGIEVLTGNLTSVLKRTQYAAVVIEWFYSAEPFLDLIRLESPRTRIVTDSVDVVFNRLEAKARVSGVREDAIEAESTRKREIDVYRRSDLVLTVTDSDADILKRQDPALETFTIPNIHPCEKVMPVEDEDLGKTLIFIGSFSDANNDAVAFFCRDVFPLILKEEPDVRLRLVGSATAPEVEQVPAGNIEVLGYVPSTKPCLESSLISIAPLRFGGGMKGKVGEAMSLGLPVVATSTGAEGFGIVPGRDALVADDPATFAEAVVRLLRDRTLRETIRAAGKRFIEENYSDAAVRKRIPVLIERIHSLKPKRIPLIRRAIWQGRGLWQRHMAWRLR